MYRGSQPSPIFRAMLKFQGVFSAGRVYVSSENIGFWLTVMSKFSSCPFPRCLCCHGYIIICESRGWAFCRTPWYDVDPSREDLIVLHTMKERWKTCNRIFSLIILLMQVMNRENNDQIQIRHITCWFWYSWMDLIKCPVSCICVTLCLYLQQSFKVQEQLCSTFRCCYCPWCPQGGSIPRRETRDDNSLE